MTPEAHGDGGDTLTACKPTVSGTISLPSRGAFHLSLTVLVHYRSLTYTQPYEVVLADSRRLSRIRRYSGDPIRGQMSFVYGAVTLCGSPFQSDSTTHCLCNSAEDLALPQSVPTTPRWQRRQAFHHLGLGSSRFARRYSGSRCCFPFLGLLRCFSSPGSL